VRSSDSGSSGDSMSGGGGGSILTQRAGQQSGSSPGVVQLNQVQMLAELGRSEAWPELRKLVFRGWRCAEQFRELAEAWVPTRGHNSSSSGKVDYEAAAAAAATVLPWPKLQVLWLSNCPGASKAVQQMRRLKEAGLWVDLHGLEAVVWLEGRHGDGQAHAESTDSSMFGSDYDSDAEREELFDFHGDPCSEDFDQCTDTSDGEDEGGETEGKEQEWQQSCQHKEQEKEEGVESEMLFEKEGKNSGPDHEQFSSRLVFAA